MTPLPALAVDLGGTKLLVGLVGPDGSVLARQRTATPGGGPGGVARAIREIAVSLRESAGLGGMRLVGVGVAFPSRTDRDRGVVYEPPRLGGWEKETAFGPLLAREVGETVYVENDAKTAALGEAWIGAGRGVRDLVYVTVSTGIGGGLILGGQLYRGAQGTAGEIGHVTVDPEGPLCYCGNRGCLEMLASGPAIARQGQAAVARGARTALQSLADHPEAITAASIADAARAGDALATTLFNRAGTYLGLVLGNLVTVLSPKMIIVGGGVSKAGDLLLEPIRRGVCDRAYPAPVPEVSVVPAALGDDVGIIGAAALVYHESSLRTHSPG